MQKPFDDFTTQVQIDELGAKPGADWINDFEDDEEDDEFFDD